MRTHLYVICTLGMALLQCTAVRAQAPTQAGLAEVSNNAVALSMPEQPLRDALNGLARQTGLQVIYTAEDVKASLLAPKIEGTFTPQAALSLLLKNSGLHYQFINPRTVAVTQPSTDKTSAGNGYQETAGAPMNLLNLRETPAGRSRPGLTLAQGSTSQNPAAAPPSSASSGNSSKEEEGTVVVTGSHIRGATGSASPVMSFDREDIRRSGVSSTQQFIQTLPQHFGGGYSETTIGGILGGEGANLNYNQASGANLRGLGNDATLTLLNGRRLAPTSVGEAVDLSVIPLAAIERIDVLTDGASAIYGSDAVAGVVNIILRSDYTGAETMLRYGNVTDGSNDERKISQSLGHRWGTGSVLASVEYSDRKPLSDNERSYTANSPLGGAELVPMNKQHSAVFTFSQYLTPGTELNTQWTYSQRESVSTYFSGAAVVSPMEAEQLSGGASVRIGLGEWQAEVGAGYSNNDTTSSLSLGGMVIPQAVVDMNSRMMSFDAKADGALWRMSGGMVRLAIGVQHRRESFNSAGGASNTGGRDKREVSGIFGEVLFPLVGADNARAGVRRLELSMAGRYEDYSDVGSTTNPKFGVLWSPAAGLDLRATYGTSFRAPTFYESSTAAAPIRPIAYVMPDPLSTAPSGLTYVLAIYGNTGDLQTEESKNWTAGLDFRPRGLPGLKVSLTYFDVDFTNRVAEPLSVNSAFFNALIQEAQHPNLITRNPPPALVDSYFAMGIGNQAGGPVTPDMIGAIVDNRRTNVAATVQSGMDFSVGYNHDTGAGVLALQISSQHIFNKRNRLTPQSPLLDSYNTIFTPSDLKLRSMVGWARGGWDTAVFLNYVDGYRDVRPGFEAPVGSWTTADLTLAYTFGSSVAWLDGTRASFAAQNFTDEDPPYINYFGVNFDATNATPMGRYLSLTVTKTW